MELTEAELTAIAAECAGFAGDNYDPDDEDDTNHALAPSAIWEGWHDKDGIEAPAMREEFPSLYYDECDAQHGPEFADRIRALTPCSRCGAYSDGLPLCPGCDGA